MEKEKNIIDELLEKTEISLKPKDLVGLGIVQDYLSLQGMKFTDPEIRSEIRLFRSQAVDWEKIVRKASEHTEDFIDYHLSKFMAWQIGDMIKRMPGRLTEEFIRKVLDIHATTYIYDSILESQKLPVDILFRYIDTEYYGLRTIQRKYKYDIPDELVDAYPDQVEWRSLIRTGRLKFSLVEKHLGYLEPSDWELLAGFVKLPEDFIIRHLTRLDLRLVFWYQALSERFVRNHKTSDIDWTRILRNPGIRLSPEYLDSVANEFTESDRSVLWSHYRDLPEWFIEKWKNRTNKQQETNESNE